MVLHLVKHFLFLVPLAFDFLSPGKMVPYSLAAPQHVGDMGFAMTYSRNSHATANHTASPFSFTLSKEHLLFFVLESSLVSAII